MKQKYYTFWRQVWYWLYLTGTIVIGLFWWRATGHVTSLTTASIEMALGNLTGLIGTYAILWQLVLLGRLTFLENVFGLEKLTWLHKWNGYLALTLILAHTVFLILAFAATSHISIIKQFVDFLFNWEDVLQATIGTILLIAIVFISIGIVRRGFKYETWYYVHIFIYLAILLAFSHQLSVGSDLTGNLAFDIFWIALYVLSAGLLVLYRFIRPTYLVFHHHLKVAKIEHETPNMISIYVTGRHLEQLKYQPGQFMIWRFLSKDLWWQAHPFSISVAPNGKYLRCTVKMLGDFTRSLAKLQPGTWVSIDGPHGNFTGDRLSSPKLLLIAGGSGITPLRALLEQLPSVAHDVVLIYTARTRVELALKSELDPLARRTGATIKYLLTADTAPGFATGPLNAAKLRTLVPDAPSREVMLCGPLRMMNATTAILERAGVPKRLIHTERFAY